MSSSSKIRSAREAPEWVFQPLPINSVVHHEDAAAIQKLVPELPESLSKIVSLADERVGTIYYDALVNEIMRVCWSRMSEFSLTNPSVVAHLATTHCTPRACWRIMRRLAKSGDSQVRRSVGAYIQSTPIHEVALPPAPDAAWDAKGWMTQNANGLLRSRKQKAPHSTLPALKNIKALMKAFSIKSAKQLGWMLLATEGTKKQPGPYTTFEISKRSGAAREICAPKWQLRRVQQQILTQILELMPVHPAAHGFVKGRSVVTNAAPHQGKALILKFDLTDFFPTIHYHRVVGLFASMGYGISKTYFSTKPRSRDVAPALARLCTYTEDPTVYRDGVLPQGAPTSPAISNLVCRRLDARLDGLAKKYRAAYTRYADDLTFSFDEEQLADISIGRFRWWVDQVCHQEGFIVNQSKFRAIRPSQRQSVTGIVVNERLRVPRELRRRMRALMHNCRTKGMEAASLGDASFPSYLQGLASYIYMVDPDEGGPLLAEIKELLAE